VFESVGQFQLGEFAQLKRFVAVGDQAEPQP
jgi:hypothetical protein